MLKDVKVGGSENDTGFSQLIGKLWHQEQSPFNVVLIETMNPCARKSLFRKFGQERQGSVRVKGRLAPLIALGAGFNSILTGRENIYGNMSILGLSTQEIDDRFDAVIDFAEIGDALGSPVHSYSSRMVARLSFAWAIHTDPDVLLIDQALVVGDIKFLAKCHRRLHELGEKGIAFILVSHIRKQFSRCAKRQFICKKAK